MNPLALALRLLLVPPAASRFDAMETVPEPSDAARVDHEAARQTVTIADAGRKLVLRLRYDRRCMLDQVIVGGRNVVSTNAGVYSAVNVAGQWHTTRQEIPTPGISATRDTVTVTDIAGGAGGVQFKESWRFTALADRILWRIEREYLSAGSVEDACFPGWDFLDLSTWTGALLGHGGVAWCKLFDQANATYGVHTGDVTSWNREERTCLRISSGDTAGRHVATRFSRQPDSSFVMAQAVTGERLAPKHELRRFLRDRQDVWAPWSVRPGKVAVELTL